MSTICLVICVSGSPHLAPEEPVLTARGRFTRSRKHKARERRASTRARRRQREVTVPGESRAAPPRAEGINSPLGRPLSLLYHLTHHSHWSCISLLIHELTLTRSSINVSKMKWTAEKDQLLLHKILEVHPIKVDFAAVAAAWRKYLPYTPASQFFHTN